MTAANKLEHQPSFNQTIEDDPEMAVGTALRRVVEDLFVGQVVADKLQATEDQPQVVELLNQHKQLLVEHLEEVTWRGVAEFLAHLEQLQAGLTPPPLTPRDDHPNRLAP